MASIGQQQAALAALVSSALPGFRVGVEQASPVRAGDGWVNVGRVVPGATMTAADCTFTVVIVLGADQRKAAELLRTLPVPLLNAVTTGALHPDGVSVEPATLPAGDVTPAELYALILTLTLEVDS